MSRFATVVAFFGAPGAALQLRSSSADKHDHIIVNQPGPEVLEEVS